MEIKNQLSINNQEDSNENSTVDLIRIGNEQLNQNSTMEPIRSDNKEVNQTVDANKLDDEIKFKLDLNIRDKLIAILNDFTSLLYGYKNKVNAIEKVNDLIHDFVDLPFKIDQIHENVINSTEILKPTLIIDSKTKTEIKDLLIKNKNYFIVFKNDKDVKSNLSIKNNNLVIKLMQFPIQMLKEDNPINNEYVWKRVLINESNYTADNHLITKLESDKEIADYKNEIANNEKEIADYKNEIANYKKEILELKKNISNSNALSPNKKESVTHYIEIKNFCHFYYKNSEKFSTLPFECLGLNFLISMQKLRDYYHFELIIVNKLDVNKKIKVTCRLKLTNNTYTSYKGDMSLNLDLVSIENQIFKSKESIYKEDLYRRFVKYDALMTQLNLTVEMLN